MSTSATTGTISTSTGTVVLTLNQPYFDNFCQVSLNGTYGGFTVLIEGSDDGTNYYGLQAVRSDMPVLATGSLVLTDNTSYQFRTNCLGMQKIRVRASARTSGTLNVRIATRNFLSAQDSPLPVLASPLDGQGVTYSAASVGIVSASTATDIFEIRSSPSKVIKVSRLSFSGTAGAAGLVVVSLLKRSTLNTGGTAYSSGTQNPLITPHDSAFPTATAVLKAYSANPTLGTLVGQAVRTQAVTVNTAATLPSPFIDWRFGDVAPAGGIIIRPGTESLSVNLNSASLTTGALNCFVEFTEY